MKAVLDLTVATVVGDALAVGEDLDEQELAATPGLADGIDGRTHRCAPTRDDALTAHVGVEVSADAPRGGDLRRTASARRHSQPFSFPVCNFAL